MNKQLRITFEDKEYTLEFTRRSVAELERSGFRAADITDKPISTLPALFAGAFRANHKFLNQKIIDEIFESIDNRTELINKLAEMYNEPLAAMLDEPEVDEAKKAKWEASW